MDIEYGQVIGWWRTQKIILNEEISGQTSSRKTPLEISRTLRVKMLALKSEFMNDDGHSVDYKRMKESHIYREYKVLVQELYHVDLAQMTRESERKSLFLNLYNCLCIDGMINGLLKPYPGGTLSRLVFYASASYRIGPYVYSLNDMENGILRGNKISPVPMTRQPFSETDSRLNFCLPCDGRIHFALNCGAKSCPPIAFYTDEDDSLEKQLTMATSSFIESGGVQFIQNKETGIDEFVSLSMIFKWYESDFIDSYNMSKSTNGPSMSDEVKLLEWIKVYASEEMSKRIDAFLMKYHPGNERLKGRIVYQSYDWALNGEC